MTLRSLVIGRLIDRLHRYRDIMQAVQRQGPAAKRESGKSLLAQTLEIAALRSGIGKLEPDEYYNYGLYDDRRFTRREKARFLGRRLETELVHTLGVLRWSAVANDKLVSHALLEQCGLPTPSVLAVFHPLRAYGPAPCLRTVEQLTDYLRDQMTYPFVAKPIWGIAGRGVVAVQSFDESSGRLMTSSGEAMSVADIVAKTDPRSSRGHLFQELLKAHPSIVEHCGDKVCSVRIIVLNDQLGPTIFKAYWKISVGANVTDNFARGTAGNLAGQVNIETGRVSGIIAGHGSSRKRTTHHPDTGQLLDGFELPQWPETVALVKRAAATMPGVPMQAWDVAHCSNGPVLLEVNLVGGMDLPQAVDGAGLYNEQLQCFLRQYDFK